MRRRVTLLALWLAGSLAACFALAWGLLAALGCSPRAVRVAVAMDQAANAALGGSEDETISSRAGKGAQAGVWRWCLLCRALDLIDPGHCRSSIEPDEGQTIDPPSAGQVIFSPAASGAFHVKGMVVATKIKTRLWLALCVFVSGLAALVVFRSLVVAGVAAVVASLSAGALASSLGGAGAGKASAVGVSIHAPAFVGALMGALLQLLQLKERPLPARIIITLVSFVAAYFGGVSAWEFWPDLGAGSVGVAGTACAYLVVPLLDSLRALLGDIGWIKRLISFRLGAGEAAPQPSSTDRAVLAPDKCE